MHHSALRSALQRAERLGSNAKGPERRGDDGIRACSSSRPPAPCMNGRRGWQSPLAGVQTRRKRLRTRRRLQSSPGRNHGEVGWTFSEMHRFPRRAHGALLGGIRSPGRVVGTWEVQRLFFRSPGARQARLLCSVANPLVFSTMAVQTRRYLRIPVAGTAVDLADRHLFVARAPRRPWKSDRASLCSAIAHAICSAASRDAIEPPAHGSR